MDPNSAIRPWLLACGKQFGIREAHDYRWPDADSRQHELYCTYRLVSEVPTQEGWNDLNSNTNFNVSRKASQQHTVTVQIDLYNSQDGLYELSAMCLAAQYNPNIRGVFSTAGVAFVEATTVNNLTTFDDEIINYHHRVMCTFTENVEFSLDETNALVNQIDLTLMSDSVQASIYKHTLYVTGGTIAWAPGTVTMTVA